MQLEEDLNMKIISYKQTPQILSHEIPEFINRFGNEKILYKTKEFSLKQKVNIFIHYINKILFK